MMHGTGGYRRKGNDFWRYDRERTGVETDWGLAYTDNGVPLPKKMPKTLHWSIPWSDLMMTMFIFFAILYFLQTNNDNTVKKKEPFHLDQSTDAPINMEQKEPRDIPSSKKESMSSLYAFSKKAVEDKDLTRFASVDLVSDKAVRIILASDLLFDTGKADIKDEARASLREVAAIIRSTPYVVNVAGHTDNVPIRSKKFPTNWELSVIRASQVARFLIDDMGITGSRFFVTGHAFHQPVKPNNSPRNRAANRRVEIIITKERPWGTLRTDSRSPRTSARAKGATKTHLDHWPWNTFYGEETGLQTGRHQRNTDVL